MPRAGEILHRAVDRREALQMDGRLEAPHGGKASADGFEEARGANTKGLGQALQVQQAPLTSTPLQVATAKQRFLQPANLLVTKSGVVKILDFEGHARGV